MMERETKDLENGFQDHGCQAGWNPACGDERMKIYTYSEVRQHLADLLDRARREEVAIRRRTGDLFIVTLRKKARSPFDIPVVKTRATTTDIIEAVRESRESAEHPGGMRRRKRTAAHPAPAVGAGGDDV